jgi:hypothetical protein
MTDGFFLSRSQIRDLTKRKKRDAQIRVLKNQRIRFTVDGDGYPVVMVAAVEHLLLGEARTPEPGKSPDFSVFPVV